ncbi:MAG: ribbon-helix-helix protein, CopG family [Chthoniobacterales bacterium]
MPAPPTLTMGRGYGIGYGMPSATKATYSLDSESLERLKRLAKRWQVSKTEVIRRALAKLDQRDSASPEERLEALRGLQKSLRERGVDFDRWQKTIRDGRR